MTGALLAIAAGFVLTTLVVLAVQKWPGTRAARAADRVMRRASRSHLWAFALALAAADSLARADRADGWLYVERLVAVVIQASWAHKTWHRAEAWRSAHADQRVRR